VLASGSAIDVVGAMRPQSRAFNVPCLSHLHIAASRERSWRDVKLGKA